MHKALSDPSGKTLQRITGQPMRRSKIGASSAAPAWVMAAISRIAANGGSSTQQANRSATVETNSTSWERSRQSAIIFRTSFGGAEQQKVAPPRTAGFAGRFAD